MKQLLSLMAVLLLCASCGANVNGFYSGTASLTYAPANPNLAGSIGTTITLYQTGSSVGGDVAGNATVNTVVTTLSCTFTGTNTSGTLSGATFTCGPLSPSACGASATTFTMTGSFTVSNKSLSGNATGSTTCNGVSETITFQFTGTTT